MHADLFSHHATCNPLDVFVFGAVDERDEDVMSDEICHRCNGKQQKKEAWRRGRSRLTVVWYNISAWQCRSWCGDVFGVLVVRKRDYRINQLLFSGVIAFPVRVRTHGLISSDATNGGADDGDELDKVRLITSMTFEPEAFGLSVREDPSKLWNYCTDEHRAYLVVNFSRNPAVDVRGGTV